MAEPFISEIRLMSFNFAPKGWAQCNGQLMPIMQNQALFSLIGTYFGGNGQTTFALPDLRGRCATHIGGNPGAASGEENHTLSATEMPAHTHTAFGANTPATTAVAAGNALADQTNVYGPAANLTALRAGTIGNVGGGQAHSNMQPTLVINFCIALTGIYPSRS